jgi:hypothetical protein
MCEIIQREAPSGHQTLLCQIIIREALDNFKAFLCKNHMKRMANT